MLQAARASGSPLVRITGPVDHAAVLHADGRGRVTIANRDGGHWQERSCRIDDLGYAVAQLAGRDDVYLSQNRFFGSRRLVAQLAQLDALFADLDYYQLGLGPTPQHVLDLALEALERARLPHPSFAISSGRGLALVWLHTPVPRQALPRWRACQQALHDALRHLGADRLATDAARVLRLVGTCNSRSGTMVQAITPVSTAWDFDELADEILPLPRAEIVALRLERAKRRATGRVVLPPARYFTAAGLWELRLSELQRLLGHRWFGTLPPGQRDLWMLLAGTAISYLVPAPIVRREIVALADQVTGGRWRERETGSSMGTLIRNAERAARGDRIEYRGRLVDPALSLPDRDHRRAAGHHRGRDAGLRVPASGHARDPAGASPACGGAASPGSGRRIPRDYVSASSQPPETLGG